MNLESDLFCVEVFGHKEDFRGEKDFQHNIMYEFIKHRGLEEDFQEYVRKRSIMHYDIKPEISTGTMKLKRNTKLNTLFNELKNADPNMVNAIINNIQGIMGNWENIKKYELN